MFENACISVKFVFKKQFFSKTATSNQFVSSLARNFNPKGEKKERRKKVGN